LRETRAHAFPRAIVGEDARRAGSPRLAWSTGDNASRAQVAGIVTAKFRCRQEHSMPRGSKKSYSSKQKRQASKIEKGAKKSGHSSKRAAQIAWATVNKQDHGGKKSGSGKTRNKSSSRNGGRRSHK
jgi:hypothetical protein